MKYGIREICDVVLKAKAKMIVGNKVFYKDEPVVYFDTLKTSTMEGASTTVYAQGGRGNPRLIAWEGDRTVTFTMEDALISAVGLSILTGAGVIEATSTAPIIQHVTETIRLVEGDTFDSTENLITLSNAPHDEGDGEDYVYVMKLDDAGNVASEPIIYMPAGTGNQVKLSTRATYKSTQNTETLAAGDRILVDYYTKRETGVQQIEIEAGKFGGNFYLEASTLFRDTNGVDMPAEFIIPNCKVQSNFTFSMAASGDTSTFTFTMDAFPDYTRFGDKKVLSAIQVIYDPSVQNAGLKVRETTDAKATDPQDPEYV